MARNRKNQALEVRFGPPLKVAFLLLAIGAAAIGYVWQKSEIGQLAKQESVREIRLKQLRDDNDRLVKQIADLHEPVRLDQRVKELNLGLAPAQQGQVVRLAESPAGAGGGFRQLAWRPATGRDPAP